MLLKLNWISLHIFFFYWCDTPGRQTASIQDPKGEKCLTRGHWLWLFSRALEAFRYQV